MVARNSAVDNLNPGSALLEMLRISKSFSGVSILRDVSLSVRAGEIHALLGENGAGKSTLIKILAGVYRRDGGDILMHGQPVDFVAPNQAKRAGIRVLYQESNLIPQLRVAENVFLGSEPRKRPFPVIDWPVMHARTAALLDRLGSSVSPNERVANLSPYQQQIVELAKVIQARAELVILDEPTALLSVSEADALFVAVQSLRRQGIGILYVSHRLDEVMRWADRATILRDGRNVRTVPLKDSSSEQLTRLILGFSPLKAANPKRRTAGAEVLRAEHLTHRPAFDDVSFSLHAGEVVGIAGHTGAGRSALMRAIYGADPIDSGRVFIDGSPIQIDSPHQAARLGIGMLSEDRLNEGVLLEMSARDNITLSSLKQASAGPFIDRQRETQLAEQYVRRLRIKIPSIESKVKYLSAGTQQKVILSRLLATQPRILIFDDPTRGVDVGARREIYRLIDELARRGVAILVVSSDPIELLAVADRILVLCGGQLVCNVSASATNAAQIESLMAGTTYYEPEF